MPPADTSLTLRLERRLVAVEKSTGLIVGALPTRLNFLADCIEAGFAYEGHVTSSSSGFTGSVRVHFHPITTP